MSIVNNIREIKPIKALRGDALSIDLGLTYPGTMQAWMKKDPNSTTYRSFTIRDGRYLELTGPEASDFYSGEVLEEAVEGKWYFDVEWTPAEAELVTRTIYTGSILFYNDITGSGGVQATPIGEETLTPVTIKINQDNHGLIVGNAIRFNGSIYEKAQADEIGNANTLGLVKAVIDEDSFIYQFGGVYLSESYTDGEKYFLSTSTSGVIELESYYQTGEYKQFVGTGIEGGLLLNIDFGEVVNENEITTSQPVENEYEDIDALLAAQVSQTDKFLQYVEDATDDPRVINLTYAYYEKVNGSTGILLSDYRLLTSSETSLIENSNWNKLSVEYKDTIIPASGVGPEALAIIYDVADDLVTGILFNKNYSRSIANIVSNTGDGNVYFKSYNRRSRKYEVAKITEFSMVYSTLVLATVEKTINSTDIKINDEFLVELDIDESGGASNTQNLQQVTDSGPTTTNNITTQGYTSTGARDNGLVLKQGDYDDSGTGSKYTHDIDDETATYEVTELVVLGNDFYVNGGIIKIKGETSNFTNQIQANNQTTNNQHHLPDITSSLTAAPVDYNISTNLPTLANSDTFKQGIRYKNTVAGTRDFGAGNVTVGVGDVLENDGSIWYKSVDNNQSGGGTLQQVTDGVGAGTTTNPVIIQNELTVGDGGESNLYFDDGQNGAISADGGALSVQHDVAISLSAPSVEIQGKQPSLIAGTYDITTNTPALSNTDTNKRGTRYRSTVAGTRDFGAGAITLGVDDVLENYNSIWYKSVDNNQSGGSSSSQEFNPTTALASGNNEFVISIAAIPSARNTPVNNTPIDWQILAEDTDHEASFITGVSGDVTSGLNITYPTVKNVIKLTMNNDETTQGLTLSCGGTVNTTRGLFYASSQGIAGFRLRGNGAGGWTAGGDYASLYNQNAYGSGYTSINAPTTGSLYFDQSAVSMVYQGDANARVKEFTVG